MSHKAMLVIVAPISIQIDDCNRFEQSADYRSHIVYTLTLRNTTLVPRVPRFKIGQCKLGVK